MWSPGCQLVSHGQVSAQGTRIAWTWIRCRLNTNTPTRCVAPWTSSSRTSGVLVVVNHYQRAAHSVHRLPGDGAANQHGARGGVLVGNRSVGGASRHGGERRARV